MTDLLGRVAQTCSRYRMIEKGELVLVGVSGGPDSLALLHLLNRLSQAEDFQIHAAHLDHSFRGREAEEEASWVERTARGWGIPCSLGKEDVPLLMKKEGLSPQEAGHLARQRFFKSLSQRLGACRVALGHHADDQAETLLLHLFTGSGLSGLQGILPIQGMIIRPLIFEYKKDLEQYCREQGLEPRRDPSNQKNIYLRNRIRNQLLPWLEDNINPNLVDTLNRTAQIIMADERYLSEETRKLAFTLFKTSATDVQLDLTSWSTIPLAIQRRLLRYAYQYFAQQGLSFEHVESVRNLAVRGQVGKKIQLSRRITVVKGYNSLTIYQGEQYKKTEKIGLYPLQIPGLTYIPETGQSVEAEIISGIPEYISKETVFFPWEPGEKYYARSRRQGDKINLKGLNGSKKIKDLFIEKKIPQQERERIILITNENEVLWIPGWVQSRIANRATPSKMNLVLKIYN